MKFCTNIAFREQMRLGLLSFFVYVLVFHNSNNYLGWPQTASISIRIIWNGPRARAVAGYWSDQSPVTMELLRYAYEREFLCFVFSSSPVVFACRQHDDTGLQSLNREGSVRREVAEEAGGASRVSWTSVQLRP